MSDKELLAELKKLDELEDGDLEMWHLKADQMLLKVLADHGYKKSCQHFHDHDKWYA